MATDSNSEGGSASFALMIFILITLVYFFIKYNSPNSGLRHTAIYYLAVIFTQYLVNLSALKQRCGKVNWSMAFTVTIIPWVLIFGGSACLILRLFIALFSSLSFIDWLAIIVIVSGLVLLVLNNKNN